MILLSLNCGGSSNNDVEEQKVTFSVEVVDGVKHINNFDAVWGDTPGVSLELVRKIGVLDGADENFQFFNPADVAEDAAGNIYIMDAGNHRIQKFDPQGRYLTTIGSKGQGPGEFLGMRGMYIDSAGRLFVTDSQLLRMKILTPEGDEIKSIPGKNISPRILVLNSGKIVSAGAGKYTFGRMIYPMRILDEEGNILNEFGDVEEYEEWDHYLYFNLISYTSDAEENIIVAHLTRNKIQKYTVDGQMIFTADRPLNYEISTEYRTRPAQWGNRTIKLPDINRVSLMPGVDEKGRIWALSHERQLTHEEQSIRINIANEEGGGIASSETLKKSESIPVDAYYFHVFNGDGHFLGRIPLPEYGTIMKIYDDILYLLDPKYEMCVYQYRIIDNSK
ncbi:MAG: 6-bladed beta-propeller [bacterium]|nr:6-bladed beta-propeller [bacterium]